MELTSEPHILVEHVTDIVLTSGVETGGSMKASHTRTVVTWMRQRAEQEIRMVVVSEALEGSQAAAERKLLALALSEGADAIEQLDALKAREATTAPRQDAIP